MVLVCQSSFYILYFRLLGNDVTPEGHSSSGLIYEACSWKLCKSAVQPGDPGKDQVDESLLVKGQVVWFGDNF